MLVSPSTFVQSSLTPVLLHDGHTPRQFGVDFIALPRFVFVAINFSLCLFVFFVFAARAEPLPYIWFGSTGWTRPLCPASAYAWDSRR